MCLLFRTTQSVSVDTLMMSEQKTNDQMEEINEREWYQKVMIHESNELVNFKLDSGAQINIIPLQVYEALGKPCQGQMTKPKVKLSTYNHERLKVRGKVMLTVEYKQRLNPVEFYIVEVDPS